MSLLKFFSRSNKFFIALCCSLLLSVPSIASALEITPMFGYTYGPKLTASDKTTEIETTNEPNIALALSWQDSTTGQGQILINHISRDFTDNINQSSHSFDTIYAHFNGVAFFKERNYITTVGMGIGAAHFKSDYASETYPSITISVGTRYELSKSLAVVTELRAYATLTKDDDEVFCQTSTCFAHFDDSLWFDGQISIGLAYRF